MTQGSHYDASEVAILTARVMCKLHWNGQVSAQD